MYCGECEASLPVQSKFCTKCGTPVTDRDTGLGRVNHSHQPSSSISASRHITEQICHVCKGKGKIRRKAAIWVTLLLTPVLAVIGGVFGTGPIALLILIAMYVNAFRGRACSTCNGHGKVTIQVNSI